MREITNITVRCLDSNIYKLCYTFIFNRKFYHPISIQAQKPVREDDIVASHKVALVNEWVWYYICKYQK